MFTELFFKFSCVLEKVHNKKWKRMKKKTNMQSMKYDLISGVSGCVCVVLAYKVNKCISYCRSKPRV